MIRLIKKFYNYFLSPDKELTRKLYSTLGFVPTSLKLFKRAFYHKSMNNGESASTKSNERLEFLGDAILSSIVAEYLYNKYPTKAEGFLTKMRSKIVKRKTLNMVADNMGLDLILMDYSQGKLSKTMLGNALEAVVGAVYLERGYRATSRYVIKEILMKYLDIHRLEHHDDNFKSQLLEFCQKNNLSIKYKLVDKYRSEKRDRFKVAVVVGGKTVGVADDYNKKSAEQDASRIAYSHLLTHQDQD